jgi:hypothetical protein
MSNTPFDTAPYLKRRFSSLNYEFRPNKYDYKDVAWKDEDLREGQKIGEFCVAEITTLSSPSSTITVFGKKMKNGIRYRIADEYGTVLINSTLTTAGPLSLGELIDFIDSAGEEADKLGIAIYYNIYNYQLLRDEMYNPTYEAIEDAVEQCKSFTEVNSQYYAQLEKHYERVYSEWASNALGGSEEPIDIESITINFIELHNPALAERLNAKYGDQVNNPRFYYMLNCEEANSVDYLIQDLGL